VRSGSGASLKSATLEERPRRGLKSGSGASLRSTAFEERPQAGLKKKERKDGRIEGEFRFGFERLEVWQEAVSLADFIIELLEHLPENRYLRLVGQMQAAVASVAQNIAEGKGRQHKKEFIQFLYIAQGSLFEVVTLSEIFVRRGLLTLDTVQQIREKATLIDGKILALIKFLRGRQE
jgi:four helix bundle protein